ncbi:MAG: cytochrome c3 family protein [Terriglobia bacterium]
MARAARLLCGSVAALLATAWVAVGQERSGHLALVEGGEDVDFSLCAGCHADKAAGPVVHPALELGCESCHQVEGEGNNVQVRLTVEGNDLCFACHPDKEAQPQFFTIHPPVRTGACVACHEPHSSENGYLLRGATESREPEENLCLGCHADIQAQIQEPVEHPAMDLGCATCHTTHKSEPADSLEGIYHLAEPQPDLCLTCHDSEDPALQEAHQGQPFAATRCGECHNPHGSEQAKLLNNFVHSPFAEKMCAVCHDAPQEGRVVLQEGARRELCLTCHADLQERLDQAQFTHAALTGEAGCVACHSPHAATYPHQLRRGPVDLCLACHTDLAQVRVEKTFLHRPVFEQSCLLCHQEHTGERPQRLRAAVNDLCLECHGRQNAEKFSRQGQVELFGGAVEVEAAELRGMPILSIRTGATRGHPFPSHPVAGEKPRNCLSCHNPHGADGSPQLLVTESASSTPLCVKCH